MSRTLRSDWVTVYGAQFVNDESAHRIDMCGVSRTRLCRWIGLLGGRLDGVGFRVIRDVAMTLDKTICRACR